MLMVSILTHQMLTSTAAIALPIKLTMELPIAVSKRSSITVNPVNDAPVALDGTITTNEDAAITGSVSFSDIDVPADALGCFSRRSIQLMVH